MSQETEQQAADLFVGIARDIRFLREVATIALVLLVLVVVFGVVVYQRHALAAAAAAMKG